MPAIYGTAPSNKLANFQFQYTLKDLEAAQI